MAKVEGQRENGPATCATSTSSARASRRLVSRRLQRTGYRGLAQRLRVRLRTQSKTAGMRRSEGRGDGGAPIFDRTHLPDRKMERYWLAREHRADARRGAREFERSDRACLKAGQQRRRREEDRSADGGHTAHPPQRSNAHVRSAALLLVKRRRLAISDPACQPRMDGGPQKNEAIRSRGSGERGPDSAL